MSLQDERCEACQAGAPRVTEAEQMELMQQLNEWKVVDNKGVDTLQRCFHFPDFASALVFTNQVGALAEQFNHHPELVTEWGKVSVSWWTHKIKGLHRNDFRLAARTDALLGNARNQ